MPDQMIGARGCLIAVLLVALASSVSAADGRSAGEMDRNEMAVLEELNLARTNPSEYARYLADHKRDYRGYYVVVIGGRRFRTTEGLSAVDEAIAFLQMASPLPPLSASRPLTLAARDHANDLGPKGLTGHVGTDGSQPIDRIRRYGTPRTAAGECISYAPLDPRALVIRLLVDDGVPGREHRKDIFNPDYRVAGIAIGRHKIDEYICVIDFADQMQEKPGR
jgi:uncharacterized protein YkwD